MRTGKEARAEIVNLMAHGRSVSNQSKMATHQHLTQDVAREQPSRLGVAPTGTNHIVVGSFGDPRPMMVGISSARKNSPRSQRKNIDLRNGKRAHGSALVPGLPNGTNLDEKLNSF